MSKIEKHETFYDYDEALEFKRLHDGEIVSREGHPTYLGGEMVYVIPEDRPSWTVYWEE